MEKSNSNLYFCAQLLRNDALGAKRDREGWDWFWRVEIRKIVKMVEKRGDFIFLFNGLFAIVQYY